MGTCCSEQSELPTGPNTAANAPHPLLASIEGRPYPGKLIRFHGSAFDLHLPMV